ncbi:selenocysteine-specific translation elongation factor [Pantoea phytobeneficialis]|uniref:Selenocysteine-specific elongation factor n=1 Tax=Pantoea phytobeneficialis TaxID=2052056 RepID=A0AAP9H151_9GAMM|nr:selenocysteine-specific translation elongation factor [Pantoea phytobeneficialis]MDO6408302.1 selenocysteine-specific translation elongation factor [Pantoea phytobeneficialis]QGR04950.1 selenocysteinyl-tRNA-specific translation elongation factor SelB [Pantoea phytobeneficialis]
MIIATAGHVDHGKTALLQALTGINADRLPEEQRRGMTIDLGYAYWPQPDGRVIGFIDVPGHEKFLANMLAGIGGIHHALLVVACDDGVMPQTREHLQLLSLAGQPPLSVALTKADRVDGARIDEVQQQVAQLTQQLGWPDAAQFVTSSTTLQGIDALRQHLIGLTEPPFTPRYRFRLAIDRAFTLKGTGLVVTGTALAGEVHIGDTLWLTGVNQPVRVRALHAQNQAVSHAQTGQRIALNIVGEVEKAQITRGDWLLSQQQDQGTTRLTVALNLLQPQKNASQPVHVHHAASHITGRLTLLSEQLGELVLSTPLWLADNDHLIIRDSNAQHTLAGGRVILLNSKKRGKRQPDYLTWLEQLALSDDDETNLRAHLRHQPADDSELAWARQLTPTAMDALLARIAPVRLHHALMDPAQASRWQQQLCDALAHFHQQHQEQPGIGHDRLRRIALPQAPAGLVLALIEQMLAQGVIQQRHGWLHLPNFEPRFNPQEEMLWQQAGPLFGDQPLWVRDISSALRQDELTVRALLLTAARLGHITAIVRDRYYRSDQIQIFADLIRQRAALGGSTTAADFRNQLGTGRKVAVQILEFFDRSGFTRRRGNEHLLRDARLFNACSSEHAIS